MMNVKRFLLIFTLLVGLLLPYSFGTADTIDLEGIWEGNSQFGNSRDGGFFDSFDCSMEITQQENGAFVGSMHFNDAEKERTVEFSGIVGSDEPTILYLAGYNEGIGIATLYNSEEMELRYIEPGEDAVAVNFLLTKKMVESTDSSKETVIISSIPSPVETSVSTLNNGDVPPPTGSF